MNMVMRRRCNRCGRMSPSTARVRIAYLLKRGAAGKYKKQTAHIILCRSCAARMRE